MAKCSICNSKKGKRQCLIAQKEICSLCCADTRNPDSCLGCQYYQKIKRNYSDVPAYTPYQMSNDIELEINGNVIEGALCMHDTANGGQLKDSDAIRIIELLIDMHHFGIQQIETDDPLISKGVLFVESAIIKDLQDVSNEEIVKILAVIRYVAKRRTKIGREYMSLIHQFVGERVGKNIRVIKQ